MSSEKVAASKLDVPMKAPEPGETVFSHRDKYVVERVLGAGAMGVVYKVKQQRTQLEFAMKTEKAVGIPPELNRLKVEALAMGSIGDRSGKTHLLHLVDRGLDKQRNFNFIIIPLIGGSLEGIQEDYLGGEPFSRSTAMQICLQTLDGIQQLHDLGFFHRDIKPANLAIGLRDRSRIYLLDYGMCRYYRRNDGYHLQHRGLLGIVGTKNWASRRVLQSVDFCRADDIETFFYLLVIYLSGGRARITELSKEQTEASQGQGELDLRMYELKKNFMAAGPNPEWKLPAAVFIIWRYVLGLHWYDRPDYEYMRSLLLEAVHQEKWCTLDEPMDWLKPENVEAYEKRKKEKK